MQKVIPAILTADPADLRGKLEILKGHTNWVHIDIMDGYFVPNNSVSIFELSGVYEVFNLEFHLMVLEPEKYFRDCDEVGAKRVIFHYEASQSIDTVLEKAHQCQFHIGMALNPETTVEKVQPYLSQVDSALCMGIDPGFQGKEFIPDTMQKIPQIRFQRRDILVGMDGGVKEENIRDIFAAGADYAVVGSGIWKSHDPADSLKKLQEIVQ